MSVIITATGKEFECSHVNPNAPMSEVYIHLHNASVTEVARVFSDPVETAQLVYDESEIEGYTKLHAIILEKKRTRIILGKE